MLIPVYRNPKYKVGDIVISTDSISEKYYHFTQYHEFVIVCMFDGYNSLIKDIDSGIEIKKNLLIHNFILKTDLKTAKKRSIELDDYNHFQSFIHKKCPHLYQSIDDREYYDACKIDKHKYCYNSCEIKDDCIYHIDANEIKNDKIVTRYLRRKKLKNIK